MFIISHLPPNLIRLLRVCLNLGKANYTMDSSIKKCFGGHGRLASFKISMTTTEQLTEPHMTPVSQSNFGEGFPFPSKLWCICSML